LDRRQKTGLTLIGIWVVIVIVIALVTHRLVALGLLGICPALAFPFRKLPAPRSPKPQGQ
jgi:hypothetical protein